MFKKLLLLAFVLGSLFPAYAQPSDTLGIINSRRQPHYIIKWAPLSLVDQDNTVQFGIEYLFKGPVSLQQEIGYGWFSFNGNSDNGVYINREIWRSRTEVRFYVANNGQIKRPHGAYLALEFLYKRMNYTKEDNVGRECENGDCEYFEKMNYKLFRDVYGFHGKMGVQFIIEKRLALDVYIGGGLRSVVVKSPGLSAENNNLMEDRGFVLSKPMELGQYTMLSMSGGFKIGYLIYKRRK
ncbi:DUF3575 domain-containing protein [Rhodocytophaga rosea]|uniref:DUF3575 domain-containing protein n=1 Tax=Rhodocytophaga rosea TaxID=2704465 RepID=A0A6C0GHE4_9BACT|nr:DUF3575 domain-containing protein [Rhodocytophaga rosea]QHT67112.1 DUF3575 domain-containing protein [Rhodocytophaga rosea]